MTTKGALKLMETDPHGWTLSIVSVCVVFSCLIILYGIYSLSGAIFSGKFKKKAPVEKAPEAVQQTPSAVNDEVQAAIALALHLYISSNAHDTESGVITVADTTPSAWADKNRNFRKLPR